MNAGKEIVSPRPSAARSTNSERKPRENAVDMQMMLQAYRPPRIAFLREMRSTTNPAKNPLRPHPQHVEVVARGQIRGDPIRKSAGFNPDTDKLISHEAGERLVPIAHVQVARVVVPWETISLHEAQISRRRHRQRLQKQHIDGAEDHRVGANTKRQ